MCFRGSHAGLRCSFCNPAGCVVRCSPLQAPSLAAHYEAVSELVGNLAIEERDRMRLVLLFALRYERDGQAQVSTNGCTGGYCWGCHAVICARASVLHCHLDAVASQLVSNFANALR